MNPTEADTTYIRYGFMAEDDSGVTDTTGEDAFLSSFQAEEHPKKLPPATEEEGAVKDPVETPEPEDTSNEEDPATGDDEEDPEDPDNQEIEVKVGDKTEKAKLKDLKRLFGQEASLTQKSQLASERLKEAEAQTTRATTALSALKARAEEAYKPYAELDTASWALLATQLTPENFNQLRADAAAAKTNVDYFSTELDGVLRQQAQTTQNQRAKESQEAIRVLSDPEKGIKGFGKEMYAEMVAFADTHGLGQEFRMQTNPGVVRILHMAMQYQKSLAAAGRAAVKVEKAIDKSQRTLKTGSKGTTSGNQTLRAAMQKLRGSGDPDDAAAAFQATF